MEIGLGAARNRFGISWRSSASVCSRRPSRRGSMRRKPLFPPPQSIQTDPATQQPVTKRKRNKGRQRASRLTINGRIDLCRRWWYAPGAGSECPTDALLLPREVTVTRGVREMACRVNRDSSSFEKAAEDLERTAQVTMSGEQLRQVVQAEGRCVLAAQESRELPPAFQAEDCQVSGEHKTRMYIGVDGVMVPTITETEKAARRQQVLEQRRRRCRRARRGLTTPGRSSRRSRSTARTRAAAT